MNIQKIFENAKSSDEVPELILTFKRPKIDKRKLLTTESRVEFLREIFDPNTFDIREELVLIALDSHSNPICWNSIGKGSSEGVLVTNKIIFSILLSLQADAFILAHNHPHKSSLASFSDVETCHSTHLISNFLGIEYLDDIIISSLEETEDEDPGYFSLRENDLFFG